MHITAVDQNQRQQWDGYVLNHPHGFAYQLYAWREAVAAGYGFEGLYLLAREGQVVRGVLPMIDFRVPFRGRKLISLPYCDAGGVLADDVRTAQGLVQEAGHWVKKLKARSLVMQQPVFGDESASSSTPPAKVLMRLDLPSTSADLLAGFPAKLRSQIKKPLRDGLRSRLGSKELAGDFYDIFARNMRDLGSPVHSDRWIRQVLRAYGERARVGVVELSDGTPVAAGIILFTRHSVSIPWASSLREWNHLNPNMLLYWTFLAFAADNGFRFFDFGRSTPGSGTFRFKAQWGARPISLLRREIPTAVETSQRLWLKSGPGRKTAEAAWSRLPLPATKTLGPKLRRFINL